MGGELDLGDQTPSADVLANAGDVQGLLDAAKATASSGPHGAAAVDFVLEGLCALKRISRAESGKLGAAEPRRRRGPDRASERLEVFDEDELPGSRKKYYN